MLGGVEVILPTRLGTSQTLDLCVRLILHRWRDAVVQDALTADVYARYSDVRFATSSQLLVYKDSAAVQSWDDLGADELNRNTMVHLLFYKDDLMVVVDDANAAEMKGMLRAIEDALYVNSFRSLQKAAA